MFTTDTGIVIYPKTYETEEKRSGANLPDSTYLGSDRFVYQTYFDSGHNLTLTSYQFQVMLLPTSTPRSQEDLC